MPYHQPGHQIELLQGATEFFPALITAIDAAQHEVQMETYIFDMTASGADVAAALLRAAQRGVKVRLVMDGVGTGNLPADWQARFDDAGVQWMMFNALGILGFLLPSRWRRLHRKLCVIDAGTQADGFADAANAQAFCGGINVLDDYYDPNHGNLTAPRFDFAVRVSGPLVIAIRMATNATWGRADVLRQLRGREFSAALQGLQGAFKRPRGRLQIDKTDSMKATKLGAAYAYSVKAALLLRDNFRNRKQIERAYLKAVGSAHQEVLIANAYFLPGKRLRKALIAAAKRGVKVQLLLQGKYEYFLQYHASRPIYSALLAAGVEIYEYAPSFLHAKVAVVDADSPKAWATVGSSNLDPLSLLLAREANVMVQDTVFAQQLRQRLHQAMATAGKKIDPAQNAHRPVHQRLLNYVALGFVRMALWITGNRY